MKFPRRGFNSLKFPAAFSIKIAAAYEIQIFVALKIVEVLRVIATVDARKGSFALAYPLSRGGFDSGAGGV